MTEKNKKGLEFKYVLIICLACLFAGVAGTYVTVKKFPDLFKVTETRIKKDVTVTDTGIADAVEKVYDSVVVVSTYQGDTLRGTGTGFVYKTDNNKAYILTNNHVIDNGTKVTVTFTNGKVVETAVSGADELSDVAVLEVSTKDIISVAEIGSSESMRVGDTTFAVGAPLDSAYSWTVTRGILSGKDRMVEVELTSTTGNYIMKVIQTDTAINNGNSGGPLCNANGEVVGITSLKLSGQQSGQASIEGMGFAIPIEVATLYAEKLITDKKITQPYLGIQMIDVNKINYYPEYSALAKTITTTKGVVVVDVESGSPADKAGINNEDVIIKINDQEAINIAYLRYYLYNFSVGDTITLTVLRDGKEKKINVKLTANTTY